MKNNSLLIRSISNNSALMWHILAKLHLVCCLSCENTLKTLLYLKYNRLFQTLSQFSLANDHVPNSAQQRFSFASGLLRYFDWNSFAVKRICAVLSHLKNIWSPWLYLSPKVFMARWRTNPFICMPCYTSLHLPQDWDCVRTNSWLMSCRAAVPRRDLANT